MVRSGAPSSSLLIAKSATYMFRRTQDKSLTNFLLNSIGNEIIFDNHSTGRTIYNLSEKNLMQRDKMRDILFEVIEGQIKQNNPPEANETFERLKKLGYSDFDAKILIGQCLSVEMYNAMKHGETYNNSRYVKNLQNLPKSPVDE